MELGESFGARVVTKINGSPVSARRRPGAPSTWRIVVPGGWYRTPLSAPAVIDRNHLDALEARENERFVAERPKVPFHLLPMTCKATCQ